MKAQAGAHTHQTLTAIQRELLPDISPPLRASLLGSADISKENVVRASSVFRSRETKRH